MAQQNPMAQVDLKVTTLQPALQALWYRVHVLIYDLHHFTDKVSRKAGSDHRRFKSRTIIGYTLKQHGEPLVVLLK